MINNWTGSEIEVIRVSVAHDVKDVRAIRDGESVVVELPFGAIEYARIDIRLVDGSTFGATIGNDEAERMWRRRWEIVVLPDLTIQCYGTSR